ncbi:Probable cadmium/zinc-transporting ATPase HMA1, chloroplastic [Linum perenne]
MEASTAIRHTIGVIEFPALRPSSSRQLHRLKSFPSLPLQNRLVSPNFHRRLCIAEAASHHHHQEHSNHHHQDDHDHRHSHGHGHHNHHHHGDELQELTGAQRAVIRFADAVRWTDLASVLREHLQLCCCSAALFVAAAICPHLAPKSVVSASLDALIEIAGGKVNIHVLMAMAAFASVFMGNALEGGLLLAMFNLAHIGKHYIEITVLLDAVPVDCQIFQGTATITIEHLTGEAKPIEAKVGDGIPGAKIINDGRLVYPAACRGSIYRALGLMMAASPCALAVAPLVYATAISSCAKKGILLKGGQVLDALASCHTIAFDKTGTLTTGGLMFKAIEPIYGHQVGENIMTHSSCCMPSCEKEALAVAAAMEKGTTHPIGSLEEPCKFVSNPIAENLHMAERT